MTLDTHAPFHAQVPYGVKFRLHEAVTAFEHHLRKASQAV